MKLIKELDIKSFGNYTLGNRLDPEETYYDRTLGYSPNPNAIDAGQDMGLGGKRKYWYGKRWKKRILFCYR